MTKCKVYLNIGKPGSYGLEAVLHCDIIHDNHSIRLTEELLSDAAIPVTSPTRSQESGQDLVVTLSFGYVAFSQRYKNK